MGRLLEAMRKWVGATLLLVSCPPLVYLGAIIFARGAQSLLFP